ncbi:aminodeoxychorismate lyase [Alloalcanivorax marinus]|uniref:aminodeoxychorismate lyase n=1 Tax=Alloalcanivorax marinus TaxID=1177169 RepID=UPI0019569BF1|nr:aminodeoxychorismate lyase [Alloalcanivorax marinus]
MNGAVASDDRGLAYGDGLFETLRVSAAGDTPLWPRHRARLLDGAARLGIPVDGAALERCRADALAGDTGAGVLKLTLTRGPGGRGYLPPDDPTPTLFARRGGLPPWTAAQREQGVQLGVCDTPLGLDPLAGCKHLNRLPQVLGRREVAAAGWDEGLMLDEWRRPVEATAMNLFAVFGRTLWTPSLERAGVAGVARAWLLERAAADGWCIDVRMRPLSHLRAADGVFLSNAVVGVLPVRKLAQWVWPVPEPVRRFQRDLDHLFQ